MRVRRANLSSFAKIQLSSLDSCASSLDSLLWSFLFHLPQIKEELSDSYGPISRYLFLDYLTKLSTKIGSAQPPTHFPVDSVLSSLIGFRVLQSDDVEVRILIRKVVAHLRAYEGRRLSHHDLDSYRGPRDLLFCLH
jgi:hypothetical protein